MVNKMGKAVPDASDCQLWNFAFLKERILNEVNKDINSKTFGCCDRHFWGWKFKDFPDLTKQYSLYPFSILMDERSNYEVDIFKGMVLSWQRFLSKDGSADQCFPGEMSAGPTLYVLHAILSSYGSISRTFTKSEIDSLNKSIRQSLTFSLRYPEAYGFVANHKALFAHCYLLAHTIFGDSSYYGAYQRELASITSHFQEGWFLEYETADPGYQTQCLHYLTLCYHITSDHELKLLINESIEKFSSYFVFPDGSYSGIFSGRGTEILYPYPFIYWGNESALCLEIVQYLYSVKRGTALVKWYAMDYESLIRLGTNYLLSQSGFGEMRPSDSFSHLPCLNKFSKTWDKAGLHIISDDSKYMVINFKRGGIFKLVGKKSEALIEDAGYVIGEKNSKFVSSLFRYTSSCEYENGKHYKIKTNFFRNLDNYLDSLKMIGLRFLSFKLTRFPFLLKILKNIMVRVLMQRKTPGPFSLLRKIRDEGDILTITDTIICTRKTGAKKPFELSLNGKLIPFHMASAGYFHDGKLNYMYDYDIKGQMMTNHWDTRIAISFEDDKVFIKRTT